MFIFSLISKEKNVRQWIFVCQEIVDHRHCLQSRYEYIFGQLRNSSVKMTDKDKSKIRFIDHDGYRQRAACICVRNEREDEILLITSRDKSSWIIPGGGIEQNESTNEAAHRELYEEAGVKGRIIRDLGIFDNYERKRRTNLFVIYVEHEYDEWEENILFDRQRHWYHLKEAFSILNSYQKS